MRFGLKVPFAAVFLVAVGLAIPWRSAAAWLVEGASWGIVLIFVFPAVALNVCLVAAAMLALSVAERLASARLHRRLPPTRAGTGES